ncbi:hypothetical protein DL766_005247 [Monosporascus sp. MC13-8B]|uniref:Calcineurin-like phosphoesterase domain-containing protein n=1 Tax=Monosporascus cannonballus TaxID=155416 RepID=A0ABY0H0T0_9PEZI|nr:hypothetical protein DL762_008327 [Monosporascus cannonballus]RYP29692.1 hypothetical protein DL766_005247 [Monosporascus sp. MC13-8B]
MAEFLIRAPRRSAKPLSMFGSQQDPVSIVCISDTHNSQPALPDGDVLIHAGDLTQSGTFKELEAAIAWLRGHRHPIKIIIAGNHDLLLDPSRDDASGEPTTLRKSLDWGDIIYLQDEEATVTCARNGRRLRVYGSPHSPRHGNWAFQHPREKDVWADGRVPAGIDVLITHGPPRAHLDLLNLGCVHLLRELWRVRPRLHVFGHIHEGAGTELVRFDSLQEAYERTVAAGGGVVNLMRTAILFVGAFMCPAAETKSLLVNASIVGGLRDQKRRKPVTVVI